MILHRSSDEHLEVIQYFLADTEMNLYRLTDYLGAYEVRHLLENNEQELLNDLTKVFNRYNEQERKQYELRKVRNENYTQSDSGETTS